MLGNPRLAVGNENTDHLLAILRKCIRMFEFEVKLNASQMDSPAYQ